ncbi:MAG TPA: glycosyltransferase [Natronosporangium sp.]
MARVLLVPFPPPGHSQPMAALAAELHARGHRITIFQESATTRWRMHTPLPRSKLAAGGAAMFRHLFFGDVVDMTRDILELAGVSGAEVIVSDVMMPGGGLAAELAGLPWATISCNPLPELAAYRRFIPAAAVAAFAAKSTLEELGLPVDDDRNLLGRTSGRLHLIPTTPGFAGHPDLPAAAALVGPFAPLPPALPAQPGTPATVVVAGSTHPASELGRHAYVQDRYLRAAVAALGELGVPGLVTAQVSGEPPTNVRYLGTVGHKAVFDRAAAVVCHGGWGTVSRALVRGLPVVIAPITGDQPYIAARCAALGLGIAVAAESASAGELRAAIEAVLRDPAYRRAAGEFAAECRALAPLPTACSLIESLVGSPRRDPNIATTKP